MRVIAERELKRALFAELQNIAIRRGSCHHGDYKQWCITGEDIEKAIKKVFADNGVFKPTIDLD